MMIRLLESTPSVLKLPYKLFYGMVKLWEKSSIAKVALKRGVQLTTSERMAEDIKVSKESVSC
jgi:hypothetical protein